MPKSLGEEAWIRTGLAGSTELESAVLDGSEAQANPFGSRERIFRLDLATLP